VNAEPTPYFRDSPTWHKDRTVAAYINSCQVNSKVGDPVDPTYLIRLPAAALLNEAIIAYGANRLAEARVRYLEAALVGDPEDLRVLNGLYLTNWRLGEKPQAADAFGKIVAAGIASKQLPLKLLFTPASTNFLADGDLRDQYALWLREVAAKTGDQRACLKVVGHTSRTGTAALNDTLSKRRAEAIASSLERQSRGLSTRLRAEGVGSRENLIGLGTDDLRDALDRRVEFRIVECEKSG
jgi:outer membrane protein OmpA-like peptidoglycan-associated protein